MGNVGKVSGIILAGGKSSRMRHDEAVGKAVDKSIDKPIDKAFLEIGGVQVIRRVLKSMRTLADEVVIVTNEPQKYAGFEGVSITKDLCSIGGPLVGIYSGLLAAKHETTVVAACDMPFLNADLLRYMLEKSPGHDVVVPLIDGQYHTLHAVYARRCIEEIRPHVEQVEEHGPRVRCFYERVRVLTVSREEAQRFDPGLLSLRNMNTPADFEEMKRIAHEACK